MDIDKTFMMGFGVDERGLLHRFNDHFNYNFPEVAYLHMTMPSGKNDYAGKKENNPYSRPDVFTNAIDYAGRAFKENVTDLQLYQDYLEVVRLTAEKGYVPFDTNAVLNKANALDQLNQLVSLVNDYHSKTPKEDSVLEASKNAVTQSLLTLSRKVGNIFSGERPVDMDDPRAATALTDKAQDSREISRENPATILSQIIQQNAGKAVVGVAAVAEKVFAASTYYNNSQLELLEKQENLTYEEAVKRFNHLGNTHPIRFKDGSSLVPNLLANANLRDLPKVRGYYNQWLADLKNNTGKKSQVIDVNSQKDISLVISAVLSAATDNAKELILDKINAGPELAGVYMHLIMKGLPFMDIAKFMISPAINKVVDKSKQNWFTVEKAGNSVDNAISYYLDGVNPYNYLPGDQVRYMKEVLYPFFKKLGANPPAYKDFDVRISLEQMAVDQLEQIRDQYNDSIQTPVFTNTPYDEYGEQTGPTVSFIMKYPINKMINDAIKRRKEIDEDENMLDEIKEFSRVRDGAKESEIFGRRLGINQGIKTKQYDMYSYDYSLNSFVWSRL